MARVTVVLAFCIMTILPTTAASWVAWPSLFGRQKDHAEAANQGQNALKQWESKQWNGCWARALTAMKDGCNTLSDADGRAKFAVALANCHFEQTGLPTFKCTEYMSIQDCTRPMVPSAIAYNTFTEYSTHTDTICFYIEHSLFSQNLDSRIKDLMTASDASAEALGGVMSDARRVREEMTGLREAQEEAAGEVTRIVSSVKELYSEDVRQHQLISLQLSDIDKASGRVESSLEGMHATQQRFTEEQRAMFERHQSRLVALQGSSERLQTSLHSALDASKALAKSQDSIRGDIGGLKGLQEVLQGSIDKSTQLQTEISSRQQRFIKSQEEAAERVDRRLDSIHTSSKDLEDRIKASAEVGTALLQTQEDLMANVGRIQDRQQRAFDATSNKMAEVHRMAVGIEQASKEQEGRLRSSYASITTGLERLADLHSALLGSFFGLESAMYFAANIFCILVFTMTQRTAESRFGLMLMTCADFFLERYLLAGHFDFVEDGTMVAIWSIRKAVVSCQAGTLIACGVTYRSPHDLTLRRLQCIEESLSSLHASFAERDRLASQHAGHDNFVAPDGEVVQEQFPPHQDGLLNGICAAPGRIIPAIQRALEPSDDSHNEGGEEFYCSEREGESEESGRWVEFDVATKVRAYLSWEDEDTDDDSYFEELSD